MKIREYSKTSVCNEIRRSMRDQDLEGGRSRRYCTVPKVLRISTAKLLAANRSRSLHCFYGLGVGLG